MRSTRPPNVLQVLPALEVGGVERGTLELARELVHRGYQSSVISAGGRLVEQLCAAGSQHLQLDIGRKSPLTIRHVSAVKRYILDNDINVIHVRSRMPAWVVYLAWKSIPEANRPLLVSTVHGPYSVNFYSKIMLRSQRVIAISDFIRRYILENYPDTDPGKITLIHRGVDNAVFNPDFKPQTSWLKPWQASAAVGDKIITLPGRITRWKGQLDFIDIIAGLRHHGLAVHGVIAGGAEKRRQGFLDEIKEKIARLQLQAHVSLIGQRDDMKEVMASSDMVMSLAKTPEAFGRTALEALCLGTPVVAYDHGGAHEVLKEMYPAGLCPPDNIEAAVELSCDLLRTPQAIGKNHVFTLENMVNRTIELYEVSLQQRL